MVRYAVANAPYACYACWFWWAVVKSSSHKR